MYMFCKLFKPLSHYAALQLPRTTKVIGSEVERKSVALFSVQRKGNNYSISGQAIQFVEATPWSNFIPISNK